jgi:transposase
MVGVHRYTQEEVGRALEVTPNCITRWVMTYRRAGVEGLRPRQAPGAERRLGDEQRKKLRKIIEAGPEAAGLDTGVWAAPSVAQLIKRRFGVQYSTSQVRRILHELGFSVQYPKRILSEAEVALQKRWLTKEFPAIKKKPQRKVASCCSKTRSSFSRKAR